MYSWVLADFNLFREHGVIYRVIATHILVSLRFVWALSLGTYIYIHICYNYSLSTYDMSTTQRMQSPDCSSSVNPLVTQMDTALTCMSWKASLISASVLW